MMHALRFLGALALVAFWIGSSTILIVLGHESAGTIVLCSPFAAIAIGGFLALIWSMTE